MFVDKITVAKHSDLKYLQEISHGLFKHSINHNVWKIASEKKHACYKKLSSTSLSDNDLFQMGFKDSHDTAPGYSILIKYVKLHTCHANDDSELD